MRTYYQIIQSAIGDPNHESIFKDDKNKFDFFTFCRVELPEKFRGLPRVWYFAILPELEISKNSLSDTKDKIIAEARDLILSAIEEEEFPLVVACDDIRIRPGDVLNFDNKPVFFLDKTSLVGKEFVPKNIQDTPILRAVRNKFDNNDLLRYFTPYTPNVPVTDWRFFGRKEELKEVIESHSNYFIIGSRKVGKTSLLQETRRLLEKDGQKVYWIPTQNAKDINEIVEALSRELSPRETYNAIQSSKFLNSDYLTGVIKRLKKNQSHENRRITLIFDELGIVLAKNQRDAWRFMGTLRELSHNKDVRIIMSAFQEIYVKQYNDFSGPFVNFATTLKIRAFTRAEIDEILINPLNIWGRINDKNVLNGNIRKYFGNHPLVLQFLGNDLFGKIFKKENKPVDVLLQELIHGKLDVFENAVTEIFNIDNSYLERYLFLKLCISPSNGGDLTSSHIKQATIELILDEIGIASSLDERNLLLDRLTLRGLLDQDHHTFSNFSIAAPIVFFYLQKRYDISELCDDFLKEIKKSGIKELNFLKSA